MESKLTKTDNPEFMKDEETGALVSTDVAAFKRFKLKQHQQESQKNDLNNIKSEVDDIKYELSEIKILLKQLLTKQDVLINAQV